MAAEAESRRAAEAAEGGGGARECGSGGRCERQRTGRQGHEQVASMTMLHRLRASTPAPQAPAPEMPAPETPAPETPPPGCVRDPCACHHALWQRVLVLAGAAAAAAARVLHARCLRSNVVSRVSTRGTTTAAPVSRAGLDAADFYVAQRQLRWLGHVARMDFGRLPRRMLSAWVPHQRPVGATRLTYGRAMGKAIWTSLTCLTLRAGTSL